jgi:hypothetical protein
MPRLSRFTQNVPGTRTMSTPHITRFLSAGIERSSDSQPGPGSSRALLEVEVNVIYTNPVATAAALRCAESLARELQAAIRLRAGVVVPWQLPLDEPHVSVAFTENVLSDLISRPDAEGFARTAELYLCRDWRETLLQVLDLNSPVIIGHSSNWWPGPENRLAKTLRSKGYRVIVADAEAAETPDVLNEFAVSNRMR